MRAKLTKLEIGLLHALQIYTREREIEVVRVKFLREAYKRKRRKRP